MHTSRGPQSLNSAIALWLGFTTTERDFVAPELGLHVTV